MLAELALIAASGSLVQTPAPVAGDAPFSQLRTAIVQVGQLGEPPQWRGTGFFLDDRCTVATAKHVVQLIDRSRLAIRFATTERRDVSWSAPVEVFAEDPVVDLAFLRPLKRDLRCPAPKFFHLRVLQAPATSDLAGEPVVIVGHPVLFSGQHLDMPVIRAGIISSADIKFSAGDTYPMLLLDLPGVPGFSGSPVILRRTGEVVGVVYGPALTARQAGFEWATPISRSHYSALLEQASGSYRP